LRGTEVESAREGREPTEQHPLGLAQQCVRPVDRGPQRLLAPNRGPGSAGQQPESVVKAVIDFVERQGAHPRCREFDRERHPVEASADFRHDGRIVISNNEVGTSEAGAIGKQFDRLIDKRQRRRPPRHFPRDPDRLTTRRQERQSRAGACQRQDQFGGCVKQMFTVVQHHQHLTLAD
jgi:hypothetical protein